MTSTTIMQFFCCLLQSLKYHHIYAFRSRGFLHVWAALTILTRVENDCKSDNPQGNGQCEQYNGLIWKTIQLAASTHHCSINNWQNLLPVALYAIRSSLCMATHATLYEKFLPFQRRSSVGNSLPPWLSQPDTVLLRRHVRYTKHDS